MGQLKIHKMHYEGKQYRFSSPELDQFKVNIIEAPNGCGKSTFFDLIYYALGGKVSHFNTNEIEKHKEITNDKSNFVELEVSLQNKKYKLVRKIGENLITILADEPFLTKDGESVDFLCLALNRTKTDDYIFSDWIMEQLDIPSIEIFHAGKNFKIGFNDLLRLVYHNQGTDVNGIYKPADNQNYVSDSAFLRKAIFEVLMGKTLVKLYKAYGVLKRKQSDYEKAHAILSEYRNIVSDMYKQLGFKEVINDYHLLNEIKELESSNDRLISYRSKQLNLKVTENAGLLHTRKLKEAYGRTELHLINLRNMIDLKLKDIDSLNRVVKQTKEDAFRLQKIIHTHKQLEMFTPDTCPYCLKNVDRPSDKCVCGHDIDENDYRRYFYDPNEYYTLLKSKVKSLETMDIALKSARNELHELEKNFDDVKTENTKLKKELSHALSELEYITNFDDLDSLEDQLIINKEKISNLKQALLLERNLQTYQKERDSAKRAVDFAKIAVEELEASSEIELIEKVDKFNSFYNHFMKKSLLDCRNAEISKDDYMPIINNGDYKEASAAVHKRFLYYLTLLQLSLLDDIPFPRLLLIDTPENIGIDRANLDRMLSCLEIIENPNKVDYQVILSTGEKKYPISMKNNVIIELTKKDKLLIKK
ncbi:AAA family ATPase [Cronobacter sakazakii]|uniref:AAA family ATPase n=1 Tax=Cronobacter sakazakii TaxID=28141 RepID=UPI000A19A228|nr:AAA family ATPase [Cronobacter sakazakii]ELY2812533.1 hypothetical protein [Cronobacter sakazakii]PQY53937.1 hypothetical protein C5945_01585 [Cronobacter sakazakii]PUZ03118.1 hypothetical protein B8W55_01585 [Cronobacter sakazakii]TYD51205.1 hypothetical protein FNN14_06085 [Cronobacter sakazakii]